MPPSSFQEIWNRGKDWLTGGSGKNSQDTHDWNRDPACDNPDFEDPDDLPSGKKRKVATGVEVSSRKRQDRRSAIEKGLTGDYAVPPDAIPIGIPGQRVEEFDGEEVERGAGSASRMSRSKVGGGGGIFRPMNTLDQGSSHAAKSVNETRLRFQDSGVVKRTLATSATGALGDGFYGTERGAPVMKKQKTGPSTRRDLLEDPIVMSDGDDEPDVPKIVSVNGKSRKPFVYEDRKQRMSHSKSRTAPFESNEARKVDEMLRMDPPKTRKKAGNGYSSSQASSRASPAAAMNGSSGRAPTEVIILDGDTSQEASQHRAKPASSSSGNGLPDPRAALTKGFDEIPHARQRRQSVDSVEYTHTRQKSQVPPSNVIGSHAHRAKQRSPEKRGRRTIPQDDEQRKAKVMFHNARSGMTGKHTHENEQQQSEESRLDQTFVRYDQASQQATNGTTRVRERMKADSGQARVRASTLRDSNGSVDELAGPTTVTSVSPEKRHPQATEYQARADGSRSSRSGSPSDLKPSQFVSTPQLESSRRRTKTNTRATVNDGDPRLMVPLQVFCSTSCYVTDGGIAMRHDPRTNDLTVEKEDMPIPVRGGKCFVQISSTEANKVFYDRQSSMVYLKGSAGHVSNGLICISFEDVKDKVWFLHRLQYACTVAPTFYEKTPEDMLKTFEVQAKNIGQAFKKQNVVAERDQELAARDQALRDRVEAKKAWKARSADEEAIGYDSDEPERPKRRMGMLGKDIRDDIEPSPRAPLPKALENSRFFDDTTRRRSTRQFKPVKQKSPSPRPPEKWTRMNKPARWPHSVVYPDEGARRVTVDFQDLERLDDGEFLNDNVISFALRRIEEQMAPEHKERVHFFNSFFYTALTTKGSKKAFNYDAVKRWTKSKDLLGSDYVVVPINIDLHWFVAIICNLPNLSRRATAIEEEEEDIKIEEIAADTRQEHPSSDAIEPQGGRDVEQSAGETSEGTKAMRNLSLSDEEGPSKALHHEKADGSAIARQTHAPERAESSPKTKKAAASAGRRGKKRGPPSYDPDKPAIITLDSFGAPHTAEVRNLKEYIAVEAEAKRGMAVDLTQLQGLNAKDDLIPTQQNFCDCGVYLVKYVEQFAKNPRDFATKALGRTLGHEGEFKGFDPSQKRDQIREELLELQKAQNAEHKAKKAGKKAAGPKADAQTAESAAATPKPESKPVSKAASPVKETVEPNATPAEQQQQQQRTPSRKSVKETEAPAQHEPSQDMDLELEAPRALEDKSRQVQSNPQPTGPSEEGSSEEEMLDEPGHETAPQQPGTENELGSNSLLENLAAYVRRNSQQMELDYQQTQQQQTAEGGVEAAQPSREEEEKALDESPDMIPSEDIIELDDEEDERDRSAEIPDSQEWSQRRTGAGVQWTGTRTSLD